MSENENRKPHCTLLAAVLKKKKEEKKVIILSQFVHRDQQMSGTVRSDCNEGDMLGSTHSYTVLYVVLLFQS